MNIDSVAKRHSFFTINTGTTGKSVGRLGGTHTCGKREGPRRRRLAGRGRSLERKELKVERQMRKEGHNEDRQRVDDEVTRATEENEKSCDSQGKRTDR